MQQKFKPNLQAFRATGECSESPSFSRFLETLKALNVNSASNLVANWADLEFFDTYGITAAEIVVQERLAEKLNYTATGTAIVEKMLNVDRKRLIQKQYGFFSDHKDSGGAVGKSVISYKRIAVPPVESADELAKHLWDDVIATSDKAEVLKIEATYDSAVRIFKELFQNAKEHANEGADFIYRRGQYYHQNDRVEITIGNNRDTFLGRLRVDKRHERQFFTRENENKERNLSNEAAAFAMFPGLSRKGFSAPEELGESQEIAVNDGAASDISPKPASYKFNQGVGLYMLSEVARECGSMVVLSGGSYVICSKANPIQIRPLSFLFPGTLIGLSLCVSELASFKMIENRAINKAGMFWKSNRKDIKDVDVEWSANPNYYSDLLLKLFPRLQFK